jgi:hypothetical protein
MSADLRSVSGFLFSSRRAARLIPESRLLYRSAVHFLPERFLSKAAMSTIDDLVCAKLAAAGCDNPEKLAKAMLRDWELFGHPEEDLSRYLRAKAWHLEEAVAIGLGYHPHNLSLSVIREKCPEQIDLQGKGRTDDVRPLPGLFMAGLPRLQGERTVNRQPVNQNRATAICVRPGKRAKSLTLPAGRKAHGISFPRNSFWRFTIASKSMATRRLWP